MQSATGRFAPNPGAVAARHIARYKLPKEVVFGNLMQPSPSGKADYRWAKTQVAEGL